jgi:hypothetical protein
LIDEAPEPERMCDAVGASVNISLGCAESMVCVVRYCLDYGGGKLAGRQR